ncbi:MAG: zinc-dependent metalloprotease [Bdellovibrionales bacterium]
MKLNPVIAALLVFALSACTKEVPYQEVAKDEQLTQKSVIDTQSQFLYIASTGETSRTSAANYPYWMGSEKLVKFQFTENALQVIETERDGRFSDNPTNNKLVLEIPITHLDYQCQKDRFGECTGQEEENHDVAWKNRGFFKPSLGQMKVSEVSVLPLELQNFFGQGCYKEVGSRLIDYELSPIAVNVRLERSFVVTAGCLDDSIESLSDLNFSTIYNYSIVRVDQLASKDYKPIVYTRQDESTFGFFASVTKNLDVDNRDVEKSEVSYLNRWNPQRGVITYYLSENFRKEANRSIRDATILAADRVNQALATANSSLSLRILDSQGQNPGDLRNNMIVMVEEPLAENIVGYGPSVAHPITGEIVSAKTIMYLGTIKKFIRYTYDELVESITAEKNKPDAAALQASAKQKPKAKSLAQDLLVKANMKTSLGANLETKKKDVLGKKNITAKDLHHLGKEARAYHKHASTSERLKDRIEAMSQHCAYPAELINFEQAVKSGLQGIIGDNPKPWNDLSDNEKERIISLVAPFVWVSTLVHELGHNLGLRHNFAGSEDVANYYSLDELKSIGVNHPITYSSVMDYAYSNLNDLPAMGKYDIAALRFGYTREVGIQEVRLGEKEEDPPQIIDRGFVPVKTNLKDLEAELQKKADNENSALEMKSYSFCTDDHVSVNVGCKRHDEGTTYTEMALHIVKAYEKDYTKRNFRNGNRNFSLYSDIYAAARIDGIFRNLRLFFELYERFNTQFNIPPELWETHPLLKDVRDATDIAVVFLTDALRTPDVMCAYADAEKPNEVAGVIPLTSIDPAMLSCFDPSVTAVANENGLVIIAQAGKSFVSKKDPQSDNPYADQIDVRGVWIEKVMAAKYLFTRVLGISAFDGAQHNLTHYDRYVDLMLQSLAEVLMDDVTSDVVFSDLSGPLFQTQLRHSLGETHVIPQASTEQLAKFLSLPEQDVRYDEVLVNAIKREVPSLLERENASSMLDLVSVRTSIRDSGFSEADFESVAVGTKKYFALPQNGFALLAIRGIQAGRDLSTLEEKQIQVILEAVKAKKPAPEKATDVEKRVYALEPSVIESYLSGEMKSETHYARLLSLLTVSTGP